jgi:pimeloyl-ACP methyl ester carboxylesterase
VDRLSTDETRKAEINGASLAYQDTGNGPPVVLVHGSVSDIRTWDRQIPALSGDYRVISYSRRYFHPNEPLGDGADDPALTHVEDLIALIRSLDAAPAHLIGHSWGGLICLLTAIRSPDVVRSLVLMEPPVVSLFVSSPPRPSELLRVFIRRPGTAIAILKFGAGAIAPAQKAFRRGDDEAAIQAYGRGVLGEEMFSKLTESRLQQVRTNLKPEKAQILGSGFPPLKVEDVRGVRVPTLLMQGDRSPKLFHRLQDRLEELLGDVERFEVPGASHIMHEDNPDRANERIVEFLGKCSRSS